MFQGLIKRAENTIDSVVAKFALRAAMAVPVLIAGGFATAALTVKLVELYGAVTGYALMAVLFGLIGLVAMAIVGVGNRPAAEAETAAETSSAAGEETPEDGLDAADLLTPEVRAFLSSAAPMALPSLVRGVGRNLPLIFILALIGFVVSRFAQTSESTTSDSMAAAAGDGNMAAAPPAA